MQIVIINDLVLLLLLPLWFYGVLNRKYFYGGGVEPHARPATWRARVSLLVWVITFDLSGKGDPASSYATAGITSG